MKNVIVLSSLVFFIVSLVAIAQPRFTPQERVKMLKEKLSLTEEQSAKVEKIITKSDEDLKNLRASGTQDREEFRKIRENSNQEINQVLNKEQKIKFKKMQEERKNRSRNMMGGKEKRQQQNPNNKNN